MIDKRERGILALTIASTLILAGIWCIYLSPPAILEIGDPRDVVVWEKSFEDWIQPKTNITYNFKAKPDRYIRVVSSAYSPGRAITIPIILVYDSENNLLTTRKGAKWVWFIPEKEDNYKLVIYNPYDTKIHSYLTIDAHIFNYRPLASIGYLLILLSLPIYGYGLTIIIQNPEKRKS